MIFEFLTHVPNAQLMVSDHGIVFYDPILSQALQGGQLVESFTYKLGDGSSVSLVGLASDLHGLHTVG